MKSEKKLHFGVEAVARIANLLQEGLLFERNIVEDLRALELVEVQDEGDEKTYLVLSEDYLKSLPESATKAMKDFIELDDLN